MAPKKRSAARLNKQDVEAWTEQEAMQFGRDHAAGKLEEEGHDPEEAYTIEDFPASTLYYAYQAGFDGKFNQAPASAGGGISAGEAKDLYAQLRSSIEANLVTQKRIDTLIGAIQDLGGSVDEHAKSAAAIAAALVKK